MEAKAPQEDPMATAVLIIRARLVNMSDRPQFDNWYRTEQLPSGVRQFKAQRAWRCWSRTNPLVHLALYEFGSVEEAALAFTPQEAADLYARAAHLL